MDCDPFAPHVNSFNYLINPGLNSLVKAVMPEVFQHPDGALMSFSYTGAKLYAPSLCKDEDQKSDQLKLYPDECRQRALTYAGKLKCAFEIKLNDKVLHTFEKVVGDLPIMVMSKLCNLHGLTGQQLMAKREEETEKGGFFIIKGLDKVLRLLIVTRQNFPLALIREGWQARGPQFSKYGVMIRCVRENHTSYVHTLHYIHTKRIMFNMTAGKQRFMIPAGYLIKALGGDLREGEAYEELLRDLDPLDDWRGTIHNMLDDAAKHVQTMNDALAHLGQVLRLPMMCPEFYTDAQVGREFVNRCVYVHLPTDKEKLDLLLYSIRKLMLLIKGEIKEESSDNPAFHEVALPGFTLMMILKEKLKNVLRKVRYHMVEELLKKPGQPLTTSIIDVGFKKLGARDLTNAMEYFLSTGNLVTNGEVLLPQSNGFSIMAERINHFRYTSHFRGIHRGAVFQDMRTTDVRKLKPEAWGFLCPVHTPDGAPCGLLNHLAAPCDVTTEDGPTEEIMEILHSNGFSDLVEENFALSDDRRELLPVFLNGQLMGYVHIDQARQAKMEIQRAKVKSTDDKILSRYTEVVLTPITRFRNIVPALYIFTNAGRMMRPVQNLCLGDKKEKQPLIEYIGTFEQIYMHIAVTLEDFDKKRTTHLELSPSAMLSYIANLIPFPDHNQSPRNVYQCQMSKQTFGSMVHSLQFRADNKMYRLMTPHTPLVKPDAYDLYDIDRYPLGTNAIVAVIAYTGYDMEDGMVINKSSYDRGFATGCVYKCERADLRTLPGAKPDQYVFARDPNNERLADFLDADGLPYVGCLYTEGDPLYCYMDVNEGSYKVKRYKNVEVGHIENVKICGTDNGDEPLNHVVIMVRCTRKPNIGDKFASRHGQKGICSFLWPSENMPFTESGMVPDIIFNPHGFPSRMTVGMMIESMAGKSAASHGVIHDATPFKFSEEDPAIVYFGKCLQKAGYNYLGNEPLYSGVDGREFQAHIFFGMVYYQRLRHMVADKFQVRATGGMDPLTRQPIKGRKKGGGVRFGEMERDAIIAHGGSAILHDRLFLSSDRATAHMCSRCGSYVSIMLQVPNTNRLDPMMEARSTLRLELGNYHKDDKDINQDELRAASRLVSTGAERVRDVDMVKDGRQQHGRRQYCRSCRSSYYVKTVSLPHVMKYLMAELVSLGIKVRCNVK